jgi:hypothetical protein
MNGDKNIHICAYKIHSRKRDAKFGGGMKRKNISILSIGEWSESGDTRHNDIFFAVGKDIDFMPILDGVRAH